MLKKQFVAVLVFGLVSSAGVSAQSLPLEAQNPAPDQIAQTQQNSGTNASTSPNAGTSATVSNPGTTNRQPPRILGIVPNFRAVSADTVLPPLSVKGKFILFLRQNFDYSSLVWIAAGAGVSQASNSPKEFGQGGIGYGRRYWHQYADSIGGNFFTNFMVPALAHQDPRYYALGHGGIFRRTGYAVSRLFIIKSDAGNWTFNISEILGNGMGASLSNAYYPSSLTGWTHTYQRWALQFAFDGGGNLLKEFWPNSSPKRNNKGSVAGQNAHP